jgi:hypothetical protein
MRIRERRAPGPRTARLAKDEILGLDPGPDGLLLRVRAGTVWATQEGDRADHVLRAGLELRLGARGRVVLWALEPAAVDLEPAPDLPRAAA